MTTEPETVSGGWQRRTTDTLPPGPIWASNGKQVWLVGDYDSRSLVNAIQVKFTQPAKEGDTPPEPPGDAP